MSSGAVSAAGVRRASVSRWLGDPGEATVASFISVFSPKEMFSWYIVVYAHYNAYKSKSHIFQSPLEI